jgi:2'-5' RNA ligase
MVRKREVEVARLGVPAHVTILSPFLASELLDARVDDRLAGICAGEAAFDVSLVAVRRWAASAMGPGVVWLEPRPSEPFVRLTRAVWAAFPECPPYGREDDELEPHLTIAIDDPGHFDDVARDAARFLPIRRASRSVSLLVEGSDGRYRTRRRFPLG